MGHARRPAPKQVYSLGKASAAHSAATSAAAGTTGLLDLGLWGHRRGEDKSITKDTAATPAELAGQQAQQAQQALASRPLAARSTSRRRQRAPMQGRQHHGRSIGDEPAGSPPRDLAWLATIRESLLQSTALPLRPRSSALRRHRRRVDPGRLLLFVVDASGSMGGRLTSLAKKLALSALHQAYLRRDRVALIAFRERAAELLFAPTNQIERARRALEHLPYGGTTPLAEGLAEAQKALDQAHRGDPARRPCLVFISDGRVTVGPGSGHEANQRAVALAAHSLAQRPALQSILVDTTEPGDLDRPAAMLADHLQAHRLPLATLETAGTDPFALLHELLQD